MTACKQTASMGAAATDSKSASKTDGAEERKSSRKGRKAKGRKLAAKSNGAKKPKTHELSNVTCGLAVMSIAEEEMSEDEEQALFAYRNVFWMENFKGVYKLSVLAIRKKATENWKSFNDSDKAPYVAMGRVNKAMIARVHETVKLTRMMTNLKM